MSARFRKGTALLSALAVLVLLGALAAGVAIEALRFQHAARRGVAAHAAALVAERALHERLASWPSDAGWMARGESWSEPGREHVLLGVRLRSSTRIVRLSATIFRVDATASVDAAATGLRGGAVRRTGLLVAYTTPALRLPAAVVSQSPPLLPAQPSDHGAWLDGRDTLPTGWECDGADSASVGGIALYGVATAEPSPGILAGDPPMLHLGESEEWRALLEAVDSFVLDAGASARDSDPLPGVSAVIHVTHATTLHEPQLLPTVNAEGRCAAFAPGLNWGDPYRLGPCSDARPLVHVAGSLLRPRGRSQGVVVIDGDLELAGGFEHHGLLVVRGTIRMSPVAHQDAPDHLIGALVLPREGMEEHDLRSLRVRFSSCVLRTALRSIGRIAPVPGGGWREGW